MFIMLDLLPGFYTVYIHVCGLQSSAPLACMCPGVGDLC